MAEAVEHLPRRTPPAVRGFKEGNSRLHSEYFEVKHKYSCPICSQKIKWKLKKVEIKKNFFSGRVLICNPGWLPTSCLSFLSAGIEIMRFEYAD
jgi:hypothetical protein